VIITIYICFVLTYWVQGTRYPILPSLYGIPAVHQYLVLWCAHPGSSARGSV